MRIIFFALIVTLHLYTVFAQDRLPEVRENVPLDSIRLSDPAILADEKSQTYYMMAHLFEVDDSRDRIVVEKFYS